MSYPYQNFQGAGGPGYSPPAGGQYAPPPQQPWGAASPPPAQNWAPQYQAPLPPPPAPSPGWQGGGYPGQGYGPNPPGGPPFPTYAAPPAAPLAGAPVTVEYPYILTAKHRMTLFTPDRSRPLFTVNYPDTMSFSWSKSRNMSILDAAAGGSEIARAEFHSFTTDKVDLWFRGREYHFKKKFGTQTGLLASAGGKGEFVWSVENGEMMLTSVAQDKKGKAAEGPILARFVPRDARDLGDATKIAEGRLELRMIGLSEEQFGEVFVTLVAEMERRRKNNEEVEIVSNAI
ncbi:hypothetical protein QBC37DRAFT_417833 [Rhypophila decipiens]|uniref:Uncharacterized protein n=1 Tax=Rhypophila decipiens TaxID=261697 RepID=A0AAN7B9V0_9PEZI|nr:hypothetical protein QBC37DRAFT_417833 [Rhypophila decipiens]